LKGNQLGCQTNNPFVWYSRGTFIKLPNRKLLLFGKEGGLKKFWRTTRQRYFLKLAFLTFELLARSVKSTTQLVSWIGNRQPAWILGLRIYTVVL